MSISDLVRLVVFLRREAFRAVEAYNPESNLLHAMIQHRVVRTHDGFRALGRLGTNFRM